MPGEVRVAISDTGVGIPTREQKRVFEKFHQVTRGLTEKPSGTGLGLAICKEIIEYHHGRIWLESNFGKGSTFTFTVPASPNVVVAPIEDASPATPSIA
jgi:signal transduction histidine kinase